MTAPADNLPDVEIDISDLSGDQDVLARRRHRREGSASPSGAVQLTSLAKLVVVVQSPDEELQILTEGRSLNIVSLLIRICTSGLFDYNI